MFWLAGGKAQNMGRVLILSLALDDQIEKEKQHEKTASSSSLFLPTPQLSACCSASVQVCFRLETKYQRRKFEATYRSVPKINTILRLRDLFCYKTNKCLPEREEHTRSVQHHYLSGSQCLPRHSEPIISLPRGVGC